MYCIDNIDFSVLSPDTIRQMSVCEVTTDELYAGERPKRGGLRDPLFGVCSRRGSCEACGLTWSDCPGHFGYYTLPVPVYAIGWMNEVVYWLRRTCRQCFRATDLIKKKCRHCKAEAPKITKVHSTCLQITDKDGTRSLLAQDALTWLSGIPQTDVELLFPGRKGFHH